jgi:hypothetical protein
MTFAQKYPHLCKLWSWLTSDSTLLLILLGAGIWQDRQMLVGFSILGLLIIKYGNKPEAK